jgi:hypothetical protein
VIRFWLFAACLAGSLGAVVWLCFQQGHPPGLWILAVLYAFAFGEMLRMYYLSCRREQDAARLQLYRDRDEVP